MDPTRLHAQKVEFLQKQIRDFYHQREREKKTSIGLQYHPGDQSNTTRSKAYKKTSPHLNLEKLDQILWIDPDKKRAIVEPRVTMEELAAATLAYGLIAPVLPEFKGITVGGAVMGMAAESSSHRWGSFNDTCLAFEILCGDGSLLRLSPKEHPDLFYGIAGSYGSLGLLVLIEIQLVPAKEFVHLRYHFFSNPLEATAFLQKLVLSDPAPDFLDGIIFSKDQAVVIEGNMHSKETALPRFSLKPLHAEWYYQHVQNMSSKSHLSEEVMALEEYLFRYDRGAFWMGAYFFRFRLLIRFLRRVLLKQKQWPPERYSNEAVQKLHQIPHPTIFGRILCHPLFASKNLWSLLHKAEKWIQDRVLIQDFCIPQTHAVQFVEEVLEDPGTFPIWICPIKGTENPQIFAPHVLLKKDSARYFMNIGIYGLPSYYAPIESITRKLEQKTKAYGGRKILYSRSYYTPDEFWQIYSFTDYSALRTKTHSDGIWHDITEKVLTI